MGDSSSQGMAFVGVTDTGKKRSLNEDSFFLDDGLQLALVADGMGGHEAGDVASNLVVEVVSDFIYEFDPAFMEQPPGLENANDPVAIDSRPGTEAGPPDAGAGAGKIISIAPAVIRAAVKTANNKIFQINCARNHREGTGMGATLVGLWRIENENRVAVFHVGDSRAYLFRDETLRQYTKDHSLYQQWLDGGSQGPAPKKNVVSRALGPWSAVDVDVSLYDLVSGDRILLCSDGLTDMVDDQAIERTLRDHSDLNAACRALVDLANRNGGVDNITAILAGVR